MEKRGITRRRFLEYVWKATKGVAAYRIVKEIPSPVVRALERFADTPEQNSQKGPIALEVLSYTELPRFPEGFVPSQVGLSVNMGQLEAIVVREDGYLCIAEPGAESWSLRFAGVVGFENVNQTDREGNQRSFQTVIVEGFEGEEGERKVLVRLPGVATVDAFVRIHTPKGFVPEKTVSWVGPEGEAYVLVQGEDPEKEGVPPDYYLARITPFQDNQAHNGQKEAEVPFENEQNIVKDPEKAGLKVNGEVVNMDFMIEQGGNTTCLPALDVEGVQRITGGAIILYRSVGGKRVLGFWPEEDFKKFHPKIFVDVLPSAERYVFEASDNNRVLVASQVEGSGVGIGPQIKVQEILVKKGEDGNVLFSFNSHGIIGMPAEFELTHVVPDVNQAVVIGRLGENLLVVDPRDRFFGVLPGGVFDIRVMPGEGNTANLQLLSASSSSNPNERWDIFIGEYSFPTMARTHLPAVGVESRVGQ